MQVPLFQRRYVWNETEQWSPLLDDLILVSEQILSDREPNPHFLGAIVLQQQMHEIDGLPTRIVIDGQQRLTTLQILIHALLECTKEMELEDVSLRLQDLVYNPKHYAKNQSDQIKLTPTNQDRSAFQKVLNGESAETDLDKITNNICITILFFKLKICKFCSINLAIIHDDIVANKITITTKNNSYEKTKTEFNIIYIKCI